MKDGGNTSDSDCGLLFPLSFMIVLVGRLRRPTCDALSALWLCVSVANLLRDPYVESYRFSMLPLSSTARLTIALAAGAVGLSNR